ncbi:MAG: acyl-CoA dehydrogenase family protein, partial [Chloroflexota bacterium]
MDFEQKYTDEQERFRKEVRVWMEANVPEEMKEPINRRADFTEEMFEFWKPKFRELAGKGWLLYTCAYPKEYGGGGRSAAQETILAEEFHRYRVPRISNYYSLPILLVWGTEEQRQQFLVPLMKGEKFSWWKLTEPHSGADLASYQSRAV